jgi:hypothetical protein
MLGESQHRLHEMEITHQIRISFYEAFCQEVGLLLIISLNADPVARLDDGFQQSYDIVCSNLLAVGQLPTTFAPFLTVTPFSVPYGCID